MPVIEPSLDWEVELLASGAPFAIGVDEVGRGAIAGPVAVGAVAVGQDVGQPPAGIRDSKLLSAKRREGLYGPIGAWAPKHAVGFVGARTVDSAGIMHSLGVAAAAAIHALGIPDELLSRSVVILDGSFDYLSPHVPGVQVRPRVKADRDCLSVAAASVIAKVERDNYMVAINDTFPGYGFERHKGYGSAYHQAAIHEHGPCAEHRLSWIH